jgi:hypothetical protein
MFCRAKIGAMLTLAGALTGWAAPLSPEQKNLLSPREGLVAPAVLKPAQARSPFGTASRWRGVKVKRIVPTAQVPASVEVNGLTLTKAADAARAPALIPANAPAKK